MLAKIYASLFDYPLTPAEARLWAIRLPREKYSQLKKDLAVTIAHRFAALPTVIAVFLTGSVAAGNAKKDADIDLMIITQPHTLWLTRLLIFSYLKLTRQLKSPICPNIFLDINHLKIANQNLYIAHEVLQAQCLFDRGGVEPLWLKENSWTKKHLPNAYKFKIKNLEITCPERSRRENWKLKIFLPFELLAFVIQYFYMKPKMTNEKVGLGSAFFHPRDLSSEILAKFNAKIKEV